MEVCRKQGWLNFVFLNNQLRNGGCSNISWSLAVQVHFYALFPLSLLLLRPRMPGFRCGLTMLTTLSLLLLLVITMSSPWMPVGFVATRHICCEANLSGSGWHGCRGCCAGTASAGRQAAAFQRSFWAA